MRLLVTPGAGYDFWDAQYDRAIAAGCGEAMALDEERLAAPDELAVATFALLLRIAAADPDAAPVRDAAAVVRLLDRALAAHGRDNGYDVSAWRASAVTCAWTLGDEAPAGRAAPALEDVARHVSEALVALPRDRLGVPEPLAAALGHALVVYTGLGG
jgi:hypothetical protein